MNTFVQLGHHATVLNFNKDANNTKPFTSFVKITENLNFIFNCHILKWLPSLLINLPN